MLEFISYRQRKLEELLLIYYFYSQCILAVMIAAVIEFDWTNWSFCSFSRKVIEEGFRMTVCSYHVTHAFQSESTLYICLSVDSL